MTDAQTLPPTTPIGPAFPKSVFDASRSFRSLLTALSRPGTIVGIAAELDAPAPMGRAMAATLLTLCDVDTPILLDPAYESDVALWSDFHTAAPRLDVSEADKARFVFAATPAGRLPIDDLAQGTQAYPDRSATCIWECERLDDEGGISSPAPASRAGRCWHAISSTMRFSRPGPAMVSASRAAST